MNYEQNTIDTVQSTVMSELKILDPSPMCIDTHFALMIVVELWKRAHEGMG